MRPNRDAELWGRLKPLFEVAVELPAGEREAFVAGSCAGDVRLEERLRALLDAHGAGGSILDRSVPERLCELAMSSGGVPAAEGEALAGVRLGERYEVEREVGAGGFGRVYVARDWRVQGRRVAVKVLRRSEAAAEVLERELAALARLHHPGIATPRDSGRTPGGRPFLVLDYIPGPSLREALEAGPMSRERGGRILRRLGAAIAAAHRAGVWHLDLKPANILLNHAGEADEGVVIVDFGIARISGDSRLAAAGSLAYAAPEQAEGAPCAASDQYSLALIALAVLTGYRPKPLADPGEALEWAARISPRCGQALRRALAHQPEDRFPTVVEFVSALERGLAPEPRVGRRMQAAAAGIAAAVMVLSLGLAWSMKREEERMLASAVGLLSQQLSDLASTNRTTAVPPRQTYESIARILENLQAHVDRGHREPELLSLMSNGLMQLGMLNGHPSRRGLGNSSAGAALLRRALETAELLRASQPRSVRWISLSTEKHNALASVLVEMGQYGEAETVARRGLALLDGSEPVPESGTLGLRIGLTMTLSRVPFHERRFEECLKLRDQAVGWRRAMVEVWRARVASGSSADAQAYLANERSDLAGMLATRGYLLRDMGRVEEALRDYGESDALVAGFLKNDPQNLDLRWLRARNALENGRTRLAMNQPPTARKRLQFALAEMRQLSAGPALDVQALRSMSMTLSFLALARARCGEAPARLEPLVSEALRMNAQAREWDPDNSKVREEGALIRQNAALSGVRLAGTGH